LTVDAYIIGTIAERAGYSSIYAFIEYIPKCNNLSTLIEGLAKELIDLDYTMKQRNEPLLNRDGVFENQTLLLQHGLILRNYLLAMRHGDSGLVRISLKIFTIWFQATRKHNYAQETIHLTACLERVWSLEMREFWMDNCLINPSGNPTGFQACDFFGEWVVREIKSMMPHNYDPKNALFLQESLAYLITTFRNIRTKIIQETGAQSYGQHSHTVTSAVDTSIIAERLLNEHVNSFRAGRTGEIESEVHDLFSKGLASLGTGARIGEYVRMMEMDYSMWADIPDNEDNDLGCQEEEEDEEMMEIQVGIKGGTRDTEWMDED
jgi:hypothetical protein